MYKLLFLTSLLFFSSCSSKYKLFQEDRDIIDSTSKEQEKGFLDGIFPTKEKRLDNPSQTCNIDNDTIPLTFQYSSRILAGDTLKIDVYNRSRRISLEQINDLNTESALANIKPTKQEYVVDMDGTLYLPILNEVNFQGLTEKEASKMLTQSYREYLTAPYVKVQIANKRVYVLGEVNKPGLLPISSNAVSLYEVIAKSGDFTNYAKRNSIQIISGSLGNQKARIVDLTKMSSLNASNLMIPANSIIYVQPRNMKSVKVTIDDFTPILQVISSTLATYLSVSYFMDDN